VARYPRRVFVPFANRFFAANLLLFFALFRLLPAQDLPWAGRVFFVWTSVFNLFVVSVFWSFMADVFTTVQGKRLFGFIGFGGTLGGIAGSAATASLAPVIGPVNLLLISMVLLELSTLAVRRLSSLSRVWAAGRSRSSDNDAVIGGGTFTGIREALSNPYLLGICAYMLLFTIGSTILYFQQAAIADRAYTDPGLRTAFFARIDLAVNVLTLATQMFLTGRIVKALGVPLTLTLLPALSVIGFLVLGAAPTVAAFVAFQVLRRAGEFAIARPTREVLYTVMSREDKYKAKNFIDTFIYRAGDQIGAWTMAGLAAIGLSVATVSYAAAPLSLVWLGIGWWLGKQQEARAIGVTS
jgi:AAA family ATP:ADP antiporter